MTRLSNEGDLSFDPEIEKTAKQLRKEAKVATRKAAESATTSSSHTLTLDVSADSNSEFEEMAAPTNNNRPQTLKELAAPNLNSQPLCIEFPEVQASFELKSGLIHLLPSFFGLVGEDPHKHLKEFHVVCSGMKPHGVTEEQIKLRAFPFSLKDAAKDWLYYIPSGSINSWNEMKRLFLEKYFPSSRAANIRKEICGIRQHDGESLYEYWERFKKLCASCPHHQISEQLLILYFYEGMLPIERSMVDAASGGALVEKTPEEARRLISIMAANSQQFGSRSNPTAKKVYEVSTSNLERQISDLTSIVRQLAVGNAQATKACGICFVAGHATDSCPTLHEDETIQQANAVGGFLGHHKYDPYSNSYNLGWKDHPNLSYGNNPGQNRYQHLYQPRPPLAEPPQSGMSLEDIVKALATNTQQWQQDATKRFQHLENQMSQIATAVGRLQTNQSVQLPSQPVNQREEAKAITLRSGKEVDNSKKNKPETKKMHRVEEEIKVEASPKVNSKSLNISSNNYIVAPFPSRLSKSKKEEQEKEILETFRKVEINIPLIDAIKQIPRYAKFLKELCTKKKKLKGNEMVSVGENVSATLQRKLPPKCKDPGTFTIPCVIGNSKIERAMLDLGASINVMPKSMYDSLQLGSLKDTRVIIQLADRSNAYPIGVVEDVLVQVNGMVFPADFYVLDMADDTSLNPTPIILGRPFLKTAQAKIDVHEGALTLEFDGEVKTFKIFDGEAIT